MSLFVLAFDHRQSFRRAFFGLSGAPTPEDEQRCRDGKMLIFEGLLAALSGDGLSDGHPGVLVDEEYGAGVAVRAREAGITVAVPLERSGQGELSWVDEPFWAPIERLDPDYGKVLVRYNPEGDADLNARQRRRMLELQSWLTDHAKGFMLELLVPAEPAHLAAVGGDVGRYDTELRPGLTLEAVRELGETRIRPDLWKLEGMNTSAEYRAIGVEVRSSGGPRTACLVLGRGADSGAVERWLCLAAPVPGFAGFAVGRTIWWQPLAAYFAGQASRADVVARIAANYRHFVEVYLDARRHQPGGRVRHAQR